jgi:hypothetical protein
VHNELCFVISAILKNTSNAKCLVEFVFEQKGQQNIISKSGKTFVFLYFLIVFFNPTQAQVSITSVGTAVTQDFNGMGSSSTATLPTGFKMGTDWSTGAIATTQAAGTSGTGILTGTSAGGFYNFANGVTSSSTDRAIGFLTSSGYSSPRSIIYAFTNNTGFTVTSISLSWNYEKYRSGTRAFDWTFFHGSSSDANVAHTSGNQSYAADANNTTISNPPSSTAKSFTISGLSIDCGSTYYLRWTYTGNGGSTNGQGLAIDDFSISLSGNPACISPSSLIFQVQPTNVQQNISMSPAVQVAALCPNGCIATSYSGSVTLSVNSPGCGYTAQTVSFVNGVATFSSIVFSRSPQNNLTFTATSSGLTGVNSAPFNVTAPFGSSSTTTIIQNDFDVTQNWGYSVGTAISVGSGGSAGTDVVGIVTEAGTGVLRKSYSVNNGSNEQGSKNTITFNNVTSLSSYDLVDFSFNVLSFGSGSGAGNDSGDDFQLDISTDNGLNWIPILVKKGFNNCLFPSSSMPETSLSSSSLSTYTTGSCDTKSAFKVSLNGISQFRFRFTAQNNRSEENWAIDNVKLTGTTYGSGVPFNLPSVNLGNDIFYCNENTVQLSAGVSSYQPDLTYDWSPSIGLSSTNLANPTVSGLTTAQTYTLNITDGDGCTSSDQITVTPQFPPSILSISPP